MRNKFRKFLPYLTFIFILVVGYLLYNNLSAIEWSEVGEALRTTSPTMAGIAVSIAALIYLLLSTYDYLSLRYLKTKNIKYPEVLVRAFVCYAFNLNLGSLVGGLALRFRVYSKWKLDQGRIPYLIGVSTFTNWLGYSFLLSLMLIIEADDLSGIVPFPVIILRLIAAMVLGLIAWYLYSCYKKRSFRFRGESWQFPSLPFATIQLVLSSIQWSLQSVIIFLLLQSLNVEVSYYQILFTFMISSIIAIFTHIPAGLGVLEVVFLRMGLGIPEPKLLVALIVYRFAYYLIPLVVALFTYLGLEIYRKKNLNLVEART